MKNKGKGVHRSTSKSDEGGTNNERTHAPDLQTWVPASNKLKLPATAATNTPGLGREAFIVAHDELRFDLLHRIHGNTHNDQQRCAAEIEVHTKTIGRP